MVVHCCVVHATLGHTFQHPPPGLAHQNPRYPRTRTGYTRSLGGPLSPKAGSIYGINLQYISLRSRRSNQDQNIKSDTYFFCCRWQETTVKMETKDTYLPRLQVLLVVYAAYSQLKINERHPRPSPCNFWINRARAYRCVPSQLQPARVTGRGKYGGFVLSFPYYLPRGEVSHYYWANKVTR